MNTWSAGAHVRVRLAIAASLACAAAPALGADFDYRVSAGLGYSDNVGRVSDDRAVDDTIATAGLRMAFAQDSKRLRADITADLNYYKYLDDTFDPEFVGNLFADTAFALIPERLIWVLTDQFGQVALDPFLPTSPDNRENINNFTTGPDFVIGLGSQMRLRAGARYSLVDYEEDPFDSSSTGGQLGLVRILSDRSSISLNGSVRDVEYDNVALNADFTQTEAYFSYQGAGARTNVKLDAGYSQLDRDATDDPESGALLRVDLSRRISASSMLILSGGREFSTAAGSFAIDQGSGIGGATGRQAADPFTQDRAGLTWQFNRGVTSLSVTGSWSKRSYDDNPSLDQSLTTFSARFRRDLSPATSFVLSTSYSTSDFEPPSPNFDEINAEVGYNWRMARNLTLEAKYSFSTRSSDVTSSEYTENRVMVTIGYGRGEPRQGRRPPTFGVDTLAPAGN